jgi:hypothetical protein
MLAFKKFLNIKNCILLEGVSSKQMETHLTHIEDLAIERGKQGFQDFVNTVTLFLQKLQGLESNIDINAKIDGAPALMFGADPRPEFKNQFFIALKYAVDPAKGIIKEGAKLLHSPAEVDQFYGDRPDFAAKLKNLLTELNRAYDNSGLIYQCDVLYSDAADKTVQNFDGEDYITFKPNVIVYAIPVDEQSPTYAQVNNSSVGVVVHDSFRGISQNGYIRLQQYGRNVKRMVDSGKRANVFIAGANFGQAKVDIDQRDANKIGVLIQKCNDYLNQISPEFDAQYVNSQVMEYLKIFINKQVDLPSGGIFGKAKFTPNDVNRFLKFFKEFIQKRFDVIIGTKKTERGRAGQLEKLSGLFTFLENNKESLFALLLIFSLMVQIKRIILPIVEQLSHSLRKTFFEGPGGTLVPTKGEGHVLFNGDTHVKIVDRLEFTKVNRSRGGQR